MFHPKEFPPPNRRSEMIACFLVFIIAIGNLATPHLNLSIFYLMPLLLVMRGKNFHSNVEFTILLAVFTIAVYVSNINELGFPFWSFRLVNRLMVVALLVMISTIHCRWNDAFNEMPGTRYLKETSDEQSEIFIKIQSILAFAVVSSVCAIIMAAIFTTDLVAPGEINVPIMYALPLVAIAILGSRKVLWGTVPILLFCSFLGWRFGRQPSTWTAPMTTWIIVNRCISAGAMVVFALFLDWCFELGKHEALARKPKLLGPFYP